MNNKEKKNFIFIILLKYEFFQQFQLTLAITRSDIIINYL